ncbi:MAG: hypothetical protein GDA56_02450 [Hormoscilla sp. GM7CHS1pb]|nr:hypothetical protein [Hormoscilla sp. GM7CHS1pb]
MKSRWREWDAQGKDDGDLLRGASLLEAVEWQQQRPVELSAEEQDFIRCSCEWKERERQERERQQQEKEKLQRRANQFLLGGFIVAVLVAGVAVWEGFRAAIGERNAEMRAKIATLDSRWVSGEESLNLQLDVIAVGKELKEASWAKFDSRLRVTNLLREMLMKWREYNSIGVAHFGDDALFCT